MNPFKSTKLQMVFLTISKPPKNVLLSNQELDKKIDEIKNAIATNLKDNCNITEICQRFNIQKRKLRQSFRDKFGVTPSQYINQVRIDTIDYYLEKYKQDIFKHTGAISTLLGYSSQESLYMLIKRRTKTTWKDYSKRKF